MVTTKGVGLNPNAKVWQEIPAHQNDIPEGADDSPWLQSYPHSAEMTEGYSDGSSSGGKEYPDSTTDYSYVSTEGMVDGIDHPDLGYVVFDSPCESSVEGDASKEQPVSEESLRESLKKQLEFCFSRENLSKDLYLISQMDNDQFVPIWTIACMEDIKALTTDMGLILDVLRASPMVQVDETGEKVRPNHSRSIIILREVSETTPVEEVEALFDSENCPKVLSAEFAHNSNWYITFQSDMDALQAYRYLREEVKMFQGKPIMARIKAINTFIGKNGFRSMDSSLYSQHAQQPQTPYSSPVYMQQVYSPQQQYPVYPVMSPSWNPSIMPYFETPLAPFPNSGFMNGYSSAGNYKTNSSSATYRPISRNRNHAKSHPRPADMPPASSLVPGALMDGLSSPLSAQPLQTPGMVTSSISEPVSLLSFGLKDTSPQATTSNGDLNGAGRARRGNHRGMRRKREDEHTTRPVMEVKAPPNFDLAASNFPPLPGCVVSVRGETAPEMRLSDVVRGLKVVNKAVSQESGETKGKSVSEDPLSVSSCVTPTVKPSPATTQTVAQPVRSVPAPAKEVDKAEPSVPKETITSSVQTVSPTVSEQAPHTCTQAASTEAPPPSPPIPTSEQEPKKLSYAEVCQRLAKDPPPAQMPVSAPLGTSQPLQELKVNRVEEPRPNSRRTTDKPEKPGESCPSRQALRPFRGTNGSGRGAGLKFREHQRGLNTGKRFSPQRGSRQSGKEQNIPPRSPK